MSEYVMIPLAPELVDDPKAIAWAEGIAKRQLPGDNVVGEWQYFDYRTRTWKEGRDSSAIQCRYLAHTVDEPIRVKESGL